MRTRRDEGQIIVLFALALVAMVSMVGLILDGGSTYAQRREEQNAADIAALAGATLQLNGGSNAAVAAEVLKATEANGFKQGGDIVVTSTITPGKVIVDVTAPHTNYFSGIVGMNEWPVSVTATAEWGVPTGTVGSGPIIFSIDAFDPTTGLPYSDYGCAAATCTSFDFNKTQGSGSDAPLDAENMAWTNLGNGNVSSDDVKNILDGSSPVSAAPRLNQYIGQSNNGVHNTLFDTNTANQPSVNTVLAGQDIVVPIIGAPVAPATSCVSAAGVPDGHTNGCFRGWALFHVTSAAKNGGGEDGLVTGYFKTGFARTGSDSTLCTAGAACPGFHGLYVLKLTN